MNIVLDPGAKMPTRAHSSDAGFDLYAKETTTICPLGSAIFDTGVHVQIPGSLAGVLISKSGLNMKHNIISTGLIDAGYTGPIVVKLYNLGDTPYVVNAGDKISQLVLTPVCTPKLRVCESLEDTDRGDNGFGSSGK